MLLTRITLQDYGVYKGRHEFDLGTTKDRPIILIGGTNGAGKTTLFESIMLCLYGISTMGKRCTRKTYEKFLDQKIHRYLKSTTCADQALISVQFKFFHNGQESEYSVTRSWIKEEGKIKEQLNIKKRNSDQDKFNSLDIQESYWQSFIEDIIPRGIVKLFFFNGEKVVKIAKENSEDITIKESFKSLLGIEVVEQLRTDLQVNLTRNLTGNDKSLQDDFAKYKAEKDESVNIVERLKVRLAQKQTEMDFLLLEIENLETKITKIGGKFVTGRDESKIRLATRKIIHQNIKQRIIDLCSDVLPFSVIPTNLEKLSEQMQTDETIQQQWIGKKLLDSKFEVINSKIKTDEFWEDSKLDKKEIKKVTSKILKLLKNENILSDTHVKPMFGFSSQHTHQIKNIIQTANTTILEKLKKDTKKIIEISEEIDKLETSIANAPNDDEIGSLISEIGQLHSQEGTLQAEMDHIEEKISSNMSLKRHLDSKLRDIVGQIYKNDKSKQHVEMTQNVQNVLDEFIEKLKTKKIQLLEQYLLDAILVLMHKKNFIEKIKIDTDTFEIKLYRKNNESLAKILLSEGEKQMFAMGILWALAKTSGRPLPFMIDTPLARLDEKHRKNVVEKFLPIASHQILIFSTDKEIENSDYNSLRPYTMHAYAMEYLDDQGLTKKHDSYFWNEHGERIVAV